MFTGIIQRLGRIESLQAASGGARMIVRPDAPLAGLEIGESIANDGVCLTAEPDSKPDHLIFFLSNETLSRTTFGAAKSGATVNLERSLGAGDRLGGHFVMGHVDATGCIARLDREGEGWILEVEFPELMRPYLAPKGSVAVDGVSLTVVEVRARSFTVAVIPHTRENTSLKAKSAGAPVNLEADVIARYVANYLSQAVKSGGVSAELLKNAGF